MVRQLQILLSAIRFSKVRLGSIPKPYQTAQYPYLANQTILV